MTSDSFRIVEAVADAESGNGPTVVVPALRLEEKTRSLISELARLAEAGEKVVVWRPLHAYIVLRSLRTQFKSLLPRYKESVTLCHERMAEPVEGGSSMDNAWLQGFSTAIGTSVLFQLQSAFQSVGEVLDRKGAYSIATFSLYIAMLSMALTTIFGWLSVKW